MLFKFIRAGLLATTVCGICFAQTFVSTKFDRPLILDDAPASKTDVKSVVQDKPSTFEHLDPGLDSWMRTHAEQLSPMELSKKDFKTRVEALSGAESLAVRLALLSFERERALKESKLDVKVAEIQKSAMDFFQTEAKNEIPARHLLTSEIASLYLKNFPEEANENALQLVSEAPTYSCASKAYQLSLAKQHRSSDTTSQAIQQAIDLSATYESLTHRRQLLEVVAGAVPEKSRKEWQPSLFQHGGNLPLLVKRHPWIVPIASQKSELEALENAIKGNQCQKAESLYVSALKNSANIWTIAQAMDFGIKIEKCQRGRSAKEVQEFWSQLGPHLEAKYGKDGSSWALFRVAQFMWTKDLDDPADEILRNLLGPKNAVPSPAMSVELRAKLLALKARVAEGRNQLDEAIHYFSMYVREFPAGEDFEASFNTLVVSYASQGNWKTIADFLKSYVDSQALVAIDKRPVGLMAFSLFWLGRSYVGLSKPGAALETWQRLSSEYYSTFYGALGHFLLERTYGVAIALAPSKFSGFNFDQLMSALSPKQAEISKRTLALLRLGLHEQARCETEELVVNVDASPESLLVRAMFLHASGAWLEAIRIYDSLPRSFRANLASGFERILFPRRYSELVVRYSNKLKLDPDLVFAVMRQESVFAKEAVSPVGAMGLMQLMPATANLELRKLPQGYVEEEVKGQMSSLSRDESLLLNPTFNVPLGVHHLNRLLQIYKSPVFALASYNASPAAAIKWKKNIPSDDILVFIERIPYKETRNYVKLILRNYFYYKRWYGPSESQEALHFDFVARDLLAKVKETPTRDVDHSRF